MLYILTDNIRFQINAVPYILKPQRCFLSRMRNQGNAKAAIINIGDS